MILPQTLKLPDTVSLTILRQAPSAGPHLVEVLEFRAVSISRLSREALIWPAHPVAIDSGSFDGERLSIATRSEVIQFHVDTEAKVVLYAFECEALPADKVLSLGFARDNELDLKSQLLAIDAPANKKTILGPPKGSIFTPPREYYIPRDIKSLLAVTLGVILIISGMWLIFETHGFFYYAWIPVVVGAYLIAATILDISLFPPWRF